MVMKGENVGPGDPKDASGAREERSPAARRRLYPRSQQGIPSVQSEEAARPVVGQPGNASQGLFEIARILTERLQPTRSPISEERDGINDSGTSTASGQTDHQEHGGLLSPSVEISTPDGPVILFGGFVPMGRGISVTRPQPGEASASPTAAGEIVLGQAGSGKSFLEDEIEKAFGIRSMPGSYVRLRPSVEDSMGAGLQPPMPRTDDIIEMLLEGRGAIADYAEDAKAVAELMQQEKAEEDAHFKGRIAALRGLKPEDVDEGELEELYRYRVESRYSPFAYQPTHLINKYVGPKPTEEEVWGQVERFRQEHEGASREEGYQHGEKYRDQVDRARAERFQEVAQLTDALFDSPPRYYSYGVHTPSYTTALMVASEPHPSARQNHRALLVGALTPSTIQEFSTTIDLVHSDATKLVTDIEGESTAKVDPSVATFVYGDASRLAVADESVDSIHTNILMRNITSQDPDIDPHLQFIKETKRALAPKGQLIMVEPTGDIDRIINLLEEAGYEDIAVLPSLRFATRRAMERSLTFHRFDPPEHVTEPSTNEMVIIATKQAAGTTKEAIQSGSIHI